MDDDWGDQDDDWDDASEEEEWSDDSDDDVDNIVVPCPSCGADIYEDAVRCPICGEYVTRTHSAWEGKPLWWVVLGVVGMLAVIAALTAL
ncbi:MAG: hypothetical protein KF861_10465 [Planctomycetaceae bacterium]|nr:hypothetical protein [Planctomycetaceae bacterium]